MTRRAPHGERGMTLIEVSITILIICIGTLATLGTYSHFAKATGKARQRAVLISAAQREMEAVRPISFSQLGTNGAPPASAATQAPLQGAAASETLVTKGAISPGPDDYYYRGAHVRIYRYVTQRALDCGNLTTTVAGQLATSFGMTAAQVQATVPNLCPSTLSVTKRITVVAVPVLPDGTTTTGVRIATIVQDPSSVVPAVVANAGLNVQRVTAVAAATPTPAAGTVTQTVSLTDTRCSQSSRQTPSSHATRDTAQAGFTCSASGPAPTLMILGGIPGVASDPLVDFSTDITRTAANGLALLRDDRAGSCSTPSSNLVYTNAETATRSRSIHQWATKAPSVDMETPDTGGRASLTLWASTATGKTAPARLCVTLRDAQTGTVIGSSDFQLASWPGQPTELVTAFDLNHVIVHAGYPMLLTLRVPSDSGSDLRILYDHASYQSSLSFTVKPGKMLQ